jgi:polysaccharide export outer membrane protein
MKNKITTNRAFIFLLILAVGCASPEKIVYFQNSEDVSISESILKYSPKIQAGDILAINVSAVDTEAALPFNLYETPIVGDFVANAIPITYLVNEDGYIFFPVIGEFNVSGLTTKEINQKLTTVLKAYINDPIINLRLMNFRITVMGEVMKPGSFAISDERISIIDAIGLAGDLTIYGERKNVTLIREQDGKRTFVNVDLTNRELFKSPYFFLTQNDVIYVEPNKTKVNSSAVGPITGIIVSAISILISIVAILIK